MKTNPPLVSTQNFPGVGWLASLAGSMMPAVRPSARLLAGAVLAVLVLALAALPAWAQSPINWGAAQNINSDSDVVNSPGTPLYAYTGGPGGTVNGVTFTNGTATNAWGSVSFNSAFTTLNKTAFTTTAAPFGGLSMAYSNILVGANYGGTGAGTVTLNSLTTGHDYSVQIWVNDPRSGTVATRTEDVTNGFNLTVQQLDYNIYDAAGGAGQFSVGYFGATTNYQAITLVPGASVPANAALQLNAISVLDLGLSQRTWVGNSGNSWGTPANWNNNVIPFPGDAITFNTLSVGTLATILDTSYTVSSLNLSSAPGPVSIGSDGNVLTINDGINLNSPGQVLTNLDSIVLGASQIWTNNGIIYINAGVSGSAGLTLDGSGVVDLTSAAAYTGATVINGGTLALVGSGSLASTNITLAGGATFDVSQGSYALNGGNFSVSSAGALIKGGLDFTSGKLSFAYDGSDAAIVQSGGALALSSSTVINVNIPGMALAAGSYTLIQAGTGGSVSLSGTPSLNVTGNGTEGQASLTTDGSGDLVLVIATPDVWTGAADNLWTTGGNWIPNNEPNPDDSILFNGSSTGHLTNISQNDPNGGAQWGVTVVNPAGPVTIGGPDPLSIYGGGFNLSAASQSLSITAPLIVNANQSWIVTNSVTLSIGGAVSTISGGNVTVSGGGLVQMSAPHVLDGLTNDTSPNSGDFTIQTNGTLDLAGNSQVMNGLNSASGGVVNNSGAGAVTLTVGGNGDGGTLNGVIKNTGGPLTLQVAGGNQTLNSSNNTYSGGTIFNGGTLFFPSATATLGTGPVTFNPGSGTYTFNCAYTNALALNGAYLHLGGNLDNQTWSGPATVTNGFQMSGDNGGCTLTLSGPMNFGTGGMSVTNLGNNGPNEGFDVSLYGDVLAGNISGSGGVTYYCNGANSRLTVQGANTYTGGTIVNGTNNAKLNVGGSVNPFSTGPVTLNAGAIIEAAPGSATITNTLTLNGGILESEPQYNNYNQLFWTGPITVTTNATFVQAATGALNSNQSSGVNVSGSLNIIGCTVTSTCPVQCYGGNTISGPISGTGLIVQNGLNTLTLSGTNTFSGTVEPMEGTLAVNNSNSLQYATLDMDPADTGTVSWGVTAVGLGALTGSRNLTLPTGTTTIGYGNAGGEYDGVLSGGNLVKVGSATITLTGANNFSGYVTVTGGTLALTGGTTYAGNTTVSAGTLSLSAPSLVFGSTVTVASGATLNLNFTGTNTLETLVLGGVSQPHGTYRAGTYSGAMITGSGTLVVGATPEIWTDLTGNGDWSTNNEGAPYNWTFNGAAANYTDGSAVQFDDSAAPSATTVDINYANVMPIEVDFSNSVNSYTIQGSYGIAGGASIYKTGSQQVTLNTPNSFIGSMFLTGGTLTVGSGGSLASSYGGNITFSNGAVLEYSSASSSTISGYIAGTGSILFDSTTAGVLTLSGANTYSGTTTISNANDTGIRLSTGAGNISPNTTFNIVGTNTSGGQLYINSGGTVSNNITISGVGYVDGPSGYSQADGALLLANGVTLSGTITTVALPSGILSQIEVNPGTASYAETINGQITGSGGVMLYGLYGSITSGGDTGGNVTYTLMTRPNSNNYLGNTELYNQYTAKAGSGGPNVTKVVLGANEQIPNGPGYGVLALGGWNSANANRSCTFELNGFNETVDGITTPVAGTADNFIQNTTSGASTLAIGDGNTNSTYGGTITDGGAGKILNLIKIGTGTLTLSGTCTTHGSITVSNGTMSCTAGACSATNVYVAGGGTLTTSVNNYFGSPPAGIWTISGTFNGNAGNAAGVSLTLPATVNLVNGGSLIGGAATYGTFLPSGSVTTTFNASGTNTISAGNLGMGLVAFNTPLATDALIVSSVLGASSDKAGTLTKTGLGTVTLGNTNIYSGGTTVSAGSLLVTNTAGSGTGTGAVNINSGGILGGTGIITGLVTNNAGGTLLAGLGGSGQLTLSGSVTLAAGSTNSFFVNGSTHANTSVALGGSVSYGGVLNIVPSGSFTSGQTFTLFSGAGAANASNFASIAGSPGAGLAFTFTNGVLSVVTAGPTLTGVSPNPVPGSSYPVSLNLTGTGFASGSTTVLLTNKTASTSQTISTPTVNSSTSITLSFVPGTGVSLWTATVVNGGASQPSSFSVTAATPVTINKSAIKSAGAGNLVLSGSGGGAYDSYAVESTTNLNSPVVWVPVITNAFDGGGNFDYTNPIPVGVTKLFLQIRQ